MAEGAPYRSTDRDPKKALQASIDLWDERFEKEPASPTAWATLYGHLMQAEHHYRARRVLRTALEHGHDAAFETLVTDHPHKLDEGELTRAAESEDPTLVFAAARSKMHRQKPVAAATLQLRALELSARTRDLDLRGLLDNQLLLLAADKPHAARKLRRCLERWAQSHKSTRAVHMSDAGELELGDTDLQRRWCWATELGELETSAVLISACAEALLVDPAHEHAAEWQRHHLHSALHGVDLFHLRPLMLGRLRSEAPNVFTALEHALSLAVIRPVISGVPQRRRPAPGDQTNLAVVIGAVALVVIMLALQIMAR